MYYIDVLPLTSTAKAYSYVRNNFMNIEWSFTHACMPIK